MCVCVCVCVCVRVCACVCVCGTHPTMNDTTPSTQHSTKRAHSWQHGDTYTNTTWRRRSCIHSRTRCHASGESHPVFESHARILFDRFSTRCRLRSSTSMSCIREREGGEREQEREREKNNERGGERERDCVSVVKQHQGVIYGSNSKEITFYTGH